MKGIDGQTRSPFADKSNSYKKPFVKPASTPKLAIVFLIERLKDKA